jgi:plastocyanin
MRFRSRSIFLLLTVVALAALVLVAACGGDDDETPDNGNGNGNGEVVTFQIELGDNFFEPNEFTANAGDTLVFKLVNNGGAVHNMRIAGAHDEHGTDDAVSDPDMLFAGDTATLTWVTPTAPGVYDFHCDFHPTDQVGTITLE